MHASYSTLDRDAAWHDHQPGLMTSLIHAQGALDIHSPLKFDTSYFQSVIEGVGFFTSDKDLGEIPEFRGPLLKYAYNQTLWFEAFSPLFFRLAWLGVDPAIPKLGLTPGVANQPMVR